MESCLAHWQSKITKARKQHQARRGQELLPEPRTWLSHIGENRVWANGSQQSERERRLEFGGVKTQTSLEYETVQES